MEGRDPPSPPGETAWTTKGSMETHGPGPPGRQGSMETKGRQGGVLQGIKNKFSPRLPQPEEPPLGPPPLASGKKTVDELLLRSVLQEALAQQSMELKDHMRSFVTQLLVPVKDSPSPEMAFSDRSSGGFAGASSWSSQRQDHRGPAPHVSAKKTDLQKVRQALQKQRDQQSHAEPHDDPGEYHRDVVLYEALPGDEDDKAPVLGSTTRNPSSKRLRSSAEDETKALKQMQFVPGTPNKSKRSLNREGVAEDWSFESADLRQVERPVERGPIGKFFYRLAEHPNFNVVCGTAVILNVLWIGASVDNFQSKSEETRVIDGVFCAVFVMELVLRLCAHGLEYFRMEGRLWNVFDVFLVVSQIAEFCVEIWEITPSRSGRSRHVNMVVFRIIRIIRMARILRLIRLVRFVGELRTILASILGSISCLIWTLVLLMVVMYGVGVCMRQIVVDDPSLQVEALEPYLGSLSQTILTLYASITGGLNWKDMVDRLFHHGAPLMGILVCLYVAFSIFALMNVVTGVFVEQAMQSAEEDKFAVLVNDLCSVFSVAEGDEFHLTAQDFENALDTAEFHNYLTAVNLDKSEARSLFDLLDADGTGTVARDEFVAGLLKLRGNAKALDMMILSHQTDRMIQCLVEEVQNLAYTGFSSIQQRENGPSMYSDSKISVFGGFDAGGRSTNSVSSLFRMSKFSGGEAGHEAGGRTSTPKIRGSVIPLGAGELKALAKRDGMHLDTGATRPSRNTVQKHAVFIETEKTAESWNDALPLIP